MAEKAEVLLRPNGGAAAERRVTVFTKAKGGVKAVGGFLLLNPKTFPRLEEAQPAPRPPPPPTGIPAQTPSSAVICCFCHTKTGGGSKCR